MEEMISDLFEELSALPDQPAPTRKVAVISTPRCGSKFFCEALANTGRFGRPREWMNISYVNAYARLFKIQHVDLSQYIQFVMAKTTTPNGLFSMNFHVEQYMDWKTRYAIDLLAIGFDRLYYLHRNDKLAQALSFAKARLTDQWRSTISPTRNLTTDQVKNSEILQALLDLSRQAEYYASHLAGHVHREFCYEDFSTSNASFHELLNECGVQHEDLMEFGSDLSIQRNAADAGRLDALKSFLGCELRVGPV